MNEAGHVLITGGAGYIGSMLVGALLERGQQVTVVDKLLFGSDSMSSHKPNPSFHLLQADVCEKGILEQSVNEAAKRGAPPISAVVHLAAVVGFPACKMAGREITLRNNVDAVRQVYEDANENGVDRFIFSSTYSVYGVAEDGKPVTEEAKLNPQSLYAETKITAEEYLLRSSQDNPCAPLIFRFATLYGASPRMRFDLIVNQFVLEGFMRGELLIFQRGYSRAFIHVQDVVAGLLLGLKAPRETIRNQVYNLGDDQGNFTKDEIVDLIRQALPKLRVNHKELSFDGDMRDVRVLFGKIRQALGFEPQWTVPQGIEEVLDLLKIGVFQDPFAERYRNAEFIVQ